MPRLATLLCAPLLLLACGPSPGADAGTRDSGGDVDSGDGDAGAADGGARDAGGADGGVLDAGGRDAAAGDAGEGDAGRDPVICDSTAAEVYGVTPAEVEALAPGTLIRCADDGAITQAEMDAAITADGVDVSSGAARFLIAYRTERQPGVAGIGSALVLVPDAPSADADAPLVVVNHGTTGHADTCAPSTMEPNADLALPWPATGLAAVAVDYAGLGTFGVQGYGDAYDTSQSVLDGARAALQLLGQARPIVLVGHSQGGGATLTAQGLAPTYAPELTVARSIAIAGGAAGSAEFTPAQAPFLGLVRVDGGAGSTRAFVSMTLYADFANRFGLARAAEGFAPEVRSAIVESMERDCIFAMATFLHTPRAGYTPPNTVGELFEASFLQGIRDCIHGRPACTPEGAAFLDQRTARDFIPTSPDGGSVLLISGSADTIYTPAQFACTRVAVESSGAPNDTCYLSGSTHFDVVEHGIAAAITYALDGTVTCPASATTPPDCAM